MRDGKLIDEGPHIDRLDRSLGELRIAWPVSRATLGFIIRELMRRNRLRDGLVYMQVTRGVARRDHAFPTTPVKPALVLTTKNTKRAEADAGPGVAVKSQPDIRWERCDIKTVALLPNVLAKQAARESGAYEAWLVDDEGRVTEGASTNAWIVTQDGELVTRQTDNGILAGITRHTLKSLVDALQLKFVERPFTLAEAKKAKEAFITSATSFVTPVVKIDGEAVGDGKVGPAPALARGICALRGVRRGGHVTLPAGLKPPRAVLFDWDNTLVNTWPTIVECYRDTFSALGQTPWTADEVRERAHGSLRDVFPTLFGEHAGRAESVFYETFYRIHLERLQPLPGADTLLAHCHGLGCYVAVGSATRSATTSGPSSPISAGASGYRARGRRQGLRARQAGARSDLQGARRHGNCA